MPLALAEIGEETMVRRIGGDREVRKHLEEMGFVAGSNVTVVGRMGGSVIVSVKGARIAISREMALRIYV